MDSTSAGSATGHILVVCTANVCRSPLARFLLARDFGSAGLPGWQVTSAGVSAVDGASMCPESAAAIRRTSAGRHFEEQHGAHLLTASDLADADLVLVASQEVRAGVIALETEARARTFTLLEAAGLAAQAVEADMAVGPAVKDLTATLHACRGFLPPARLSLRERMVPPRRRAIDGIDITDAHSGEARHIDVTDAVVRASWELATTVVRLSAAA